MPAHLEQYGETWKEHHPGWKHVLWTDDDLPHLVNDRVWRDAEQIAPHNVGQLRADVVRYELLLQFGGVWVDCDLECMRPLDVLIRDVDCFAGWEKQAQWVGNSILGSVPGHPFMRALVGGLAANVRRRIGARPAVMSGPQYVTRMYRGYAKQVTVFAEATFYPYGFAELDRQGESFPDSYTAHHWGNRRCKTGQPGWEYAR